MRRMPFCRYAKKDCFVLMRRMPVLFQCGECPFCLRVENACFVPMRRCVFLSKCKECLFCRNAENACLILMAENACFVFLQSMLILSQYGEYCSWFVSVRIIIGFFSSSFSHCGYAGYVAVNLLSCFSKPATHVKTKSRFHIFPKVKMPSSLELRLKLSPLP